MTVPTPGWRDLLAYGLFLLVGLVIYVRSNLVRVNPTPYLLGYRVLHVRYGTDKQQFLGHTRRPGGRADRDGERRGRRLVGVRGHRCAPGRNGLAAPSGVALPWCSAGGAGPRLPLAA